MDKGFVNDNAKLVWQLFEKTGLICYYNLYKNIQCPNKENNKEELSL